MKIKYIPLPTIRKFHESSEQYRIIIGSVGSGKTAGCIMELLYYLPIYLFRKYNIKKTRMLILRNTYCQLKDTTLNTLYQWFPSFDLKIQSMTGILKHSGLEIEVLLRSCDRPQDIRRFKSLEITAALLDEANEISNEIHLMVANRIGRYPSKQEIKELSNKDIGRLGWFIAASNPPDIDHFIYTDYKYLTDIPGPVPEGTPLANHYGFWQPYLENESNLPKDYYKNLLITYANYPEWAKRYVKGEPCTKVEGKLVWNNFVHNLHVSKEPITWTGGTLYVGWDHSGNVPACVVAQIPTTGLVQILKTYFTEKMSMTDFTNYVIQDRNLNFPNAKYEEWGDPAGFNKFSHPSGGFTSNSDIMKDLGIDIKPSEQNWNARREAVDNILSRLVSGMPALQIDPSCKILINSFLGGYCYGEIGTTGYYHKEPLKNKFSHICDALQYLILRVTTNIRKKNKNKIIHGLNWKNRVKGNKYLEEYN